MILALVFIEQPKFGFGTELKSLFWKNMKNMSYVRTVWWNLEGL